MNNLLEKFQQFEVSSQSQIYNDNLKNMRWWGKKYRMSGCTSQREKDHFSS